MASRKIAVVVGTRPEAIKMGPLYLELTKMFGSRQVELCSTGQHRDLLSEVFDFFEITPSFDLEVMLEKPDLARMTSNILEKFSHYLESSKPGLVLVHGDTTSSYVAALASFYRMIPVGHVEAGLRTGNSRRPFPEEMNRRAISIMSDIHFAPTDVSCSNLLREGFPPESIHRVGNTVVDAVNLVKARLDSGVLVGFESFPTLKEEPVFLPSDGGYILVTVHRRENVGTPLQDILSAVRTLASTLPKILVVVTVHPNPSIRSPILDRLSGLRNVVLLPPQPYLSFAQLMKFARLILTDSGGVQEEAVSFGIPTLVLREETERPEGIETGLVELVGSDTRKIIERTSALICRSNQIQIGESPYGDGRSSMKIAGLIREYLGE